MLWTVLLLGQAFAEEPAWWWKVSHQGTVTPSCAQFTQDVEVYRGPQLPSTCEVDGVSAGDAFSLRVRPLATLGDVRFISAMHRLTPAGVHPRQQEQWVAYDQHTHQTVPPTAWLQEASLLRAIFDEPWLRSQGLLSDKARQAKSFKALVAASPEVGWQTVVPYNFSDIRGELAVRLGVLPESTRCDRCPNAVVQLDLLVMAAPDVRRRGIWMQNIERAPAASVADMRWSIDGFAASRRGPRTPASDVLRSDFRKRFVDPVVHSTRRAPGGRFEIIEVFDRSQMQERPIRTSLWITDTDTPTPFSRPALWERILALEPLSNSEHAMGWAQLMALTTEHVRSVWVWRSSMVNEHLPAGLAARLDEPEVRHDGSAWVVRFDTVQVERSFGLVPRHELTVTRWSFRLDGRRSSYERVVLLSPGD